MSTITNGFRRKSRSCRRRTFCVTFFISAIFLCVSSSKGALNGGRNTKHTAHKPRQLQDYLLNPGPPISCNFWMSTVQEDGFTQGNGIVFAMQSRDGDDDGVKITSFGFHVPAAKIQTVQFQVYALIQEGYYADPNRDTFNQGVNFDYRGNSQLGLWEMISSGTIRNSDLIADDTNAGDTTFYQIPFDDFTATDIPPNGGVRSFFISTSLLYTSPTSGEGINAVQQSEGYSDPQAPELLVGEGTSGFSETKFLYKTRMYVGKFFYETNCASEAPSISMSPTTSKPTSSPSLSPTISHAPTETVEQAGAEAAIVFPLLECDPNQATVPQEVQDAVSDQVTYTLTTGEEAADFSNIESAVLGAKVTCDERRLTGDENKHDRLLATRSSAMEFTLVITGDYRSLDGKPPDMGPVVEDSINADATKFTKELKERSANPLLEQATEPQVEARTLDNDELEQFNEGTFEVTITRTIPSPSPTEPPPDKVKTALLSVIVIVSGVMVVLASFLLFRHAQHRAMVNRREKEDDLYEKKMTALEEETIKQGWEKENARRMATNDWHDTNTKKQSDYPAYYGGAPPQHQNYQDSYEGDDHY